MVTLGFVASETVPNNETLPNNETVPKTPHTETEPNDKTVLETPNSHLLISQAVNAFEEVDGGNEITTPEIGMVFPTGDEFAAFVYSYAYKSGFELFLRTSELFEEYKKKGVSRKSSGEKEAEFYMFKRIRFMCTKGAECKHPGSNVIGYEFVIDGRIKHRQTMMEITVCKLQHNHVIVPANRRFVVSYRVISDYFKKRMMNNDAAGIPLITNYNSLVLEAGGHENLQFNKHDLRNAVSLERRRTRLGGDARALEEYFKKMKDENGNFFYAIQRDENDRLLNVFWADARCRALFKSFPDVVTYDTTFRCKRFEMPFSPFIGVNHHGKSTLFAAALISHEDSDTFCWVFNKWLECMGKPPSVIITDQCKAIGKAIRIVFGTNFPHKLCLWHIMRNAAKILGSYSDWLKIKHDLFMAVHDSLDVVEFEELWSELVTKYQIGENPCIKESWDVRRQWVPVYWKCIFCAGMSSTQRSEQQNRFLKQYVSIECGLRNFVTQFENAILDKVNEEQELNFIDLDRLLKLVGETLVESVFSKLYTNNIFRFVPD
ncbi:hypothetical protein RND81_04G238900 [Saponaria officinalis]|uniref:MULE transposase domain-containing protein n=1 Tax=Saponaria officinalis TaxID=3572 RepID=A0AAW1LPE1_SAPOF